MADFKLKHFLFLILLSFCTLKCQSGMSFAPTIYPLAGSVNVINGSYYEASHDLTLFGSKPIAIKKFFFGANTGHSPDGLCWHFNYKNIISSDITAIEEPIFDSEVEYEYDILSRLTNLKFYKTNKTKTLHQIDFEYISNEENSSCIATSSDGRSIAYFYHTTEPSRSNPEIVIDAFLDVNGAKTSYEYVNHPNERKYLLKKITDPEGGYIENEYYSGKYNNVGGELVTIDDFSRSPHIGRIKLQKAPLGSCNSPIITQRFFYYNDHTDVILSNGVKNRYYFSKNQKVTQIETYFKNESLPYKVQNIFWSNELEQKIECITLKDMFGEIHSCEVYLYDAFGNIIEERTYGNLSGKGLNKIILNEHGKPIDNGTEFSSTIYTYHPETHLLLKTTEPSGKITRNVYDSISRKKLATFIEDSNQIWMRQFFLYDEENRVIKTITDNGTSEGIDSLENVTERHIVNFTFSNESFGIDLPSSTEECYYDFNSASEQLIKKTVHQYNSMNLVEQQDIFNSNGRLTKTLSYKYDKCGQCIEFKDSLGSEKFITYDLCGRIVEEIDISQNIIIKHVKNNYDIAGRLVRKLEVDSSKKENQSTFHYDFMNNCIASIDSYGNETHYLYDDLGRLITTEYPAILDTNDQLKHPKIHFSYDIAGNITQTIDANGYKTNIDYNLRKNPTNIFHPDGTTEHFIYNLDGTLLEKTTTDGLIVRYERDIFGRVTDEKILSPSGWLISHTQNSYNAFHLISTKDLSEKTLTHFYSLDGKLIKTEESIGDCFQFTEYQYDDLGRKSIEKLHYGPNKKDCFIKINQFDDLGNVVCTKIENYQGKIIRVLKISQNNSVDENSNPYCRERNQLNLTNTIFDKKGNSTLVTYDTMKRPISIIKKDMMGKIIRNIAYKYDLSGNQVKETHLIFDSENISKSYTISKKYGPKNRLENLIEGEGSKNQRSFFYSYDAYGKLQSITKNDGVILYYLYNDKRQIEKFFSSDQSINYEYYYDNLGNITHVHDHINNLITEKKYDNLNRLTSEYLANGLSIDYTLDALGRNTGYTLPDGSSIEHLYTDLDLSQIDRYSAQKKLLYSHKYKKFDLNGRLLLAEMIKNLGDIQYDYNSEGFCESICTPFWKEKLFFDNENTSIIQTTMDYIGTTNKILQFNSENSLVSESENNIVKNQYDSLGNRICFDGNKEYLHNELNELIYDGINNYKYDLNGNQIEIANVNSKTIFSYDALNRLDTVQINNHTKIKFIYDSLNRRLEKKIYSLDKSNEWKTVKILRYLYIGNNEIGMVNEANEIEELRILGLHSESTPGTAIAFEINGEIFSPIHDQHGNLRSVIDTINAKVRECYRYTSFGIETIYDEVGSALPSKLSICPWRYSGKRIDVETNLIFFGKRYYQPSTGRWTTLDPLGLYDGINRYLYSQNNPITNIDQYGMFSVSTAWNNFLDFFNQCFNAITNFGGKTIGFIRAETEYIQQIQPNMTVLFENYFGKGFLTLMGYYTHPLENGVYGQGDVHDKVRITLINGILNTRAYYSGTLDFLNKTHGGANIHYIFRPTGGWCSDFLQGILVKCGYVSPYAKVLASTWKQLIADMGGVEGGGMIIHYCHSLGGADTIGAASLLTPEELSMIKVVSFGSASIISNGIGFSEAVNYISIRDGVSLFADPIGYIKGLMQKDSNVIFIGSFFGLPFVDHALAVQSYTETVTNLGNIFMETYANSM